VNIIQKSPKDLGESLDYLFQLGFGGEHLEKHLSNLDKESNEARGMIRHYQQFHGDLNPDGILGPYTEIHLSRPRCGCPDLLRRRGGGFSKWGSDCKHSITTNHDLSGRSGMTSDEIEQIWIDQLNRWMAVCDITMTYNPKLKDPLISAKWGGMGRGTLAWSYITNGCSSRITQLYNRSVDWGPKYFGATILHEIGHANGLSHQPAGNIMYYSITDQTELGPRDIAQMVSRYEEAKDRPDPPQPPTDDGKGLTIRVTGDNLKYTIEQGGGGHDFK